MASGQHCADLDDVSSAAEDEPLSVAMALADALHHSAQPKARTGARAATDAATHTVEHAAPTPVDEHIAPAPAVHFAPAPAVHAAAAPVSACVTHAPDLNLASLLEPPVPVIQVVPVPQVHLFETTVVISESFTGQDTQISENLGAASVRRVCFAEIVEVVCRTSSSDTRDDNRGRRAFLWWWNVLYLLPVDELVPPAPALTYAAPGLRG